MTGSEYESDTSNDADTQPSGPESGVETRQRRDVTAYLTYGGLALLSLLAVVASFRFYTSASRAIGVWVTPEFEPLVQAAFNLAVVLLAGAGISVLVRRLR